MKKSKRFSVKKLLLTILCTVIVSVFLGSTILFVTSIPQWIQAEVITSMGKGSESLIEIGETYQPAYEQAQKMFKEEKALYGENYPTEVLFLLQLRNLSINRIMQVYSISFLIGIVLGTIIYIVVIQNIQWKQIFIELVVAFIILLLLMTMINLGYEIIINKAIQSINPTGATYFTYIYNFENKNLLLLYTIIAIIIYVINMARQKIITNKLNNQLNFK